MLIAVNYHYVRPQFDSPHPGVFGVTSAAFEEQIEMLGRAGEFVGAADIRAAVKGVRPLPDRAIVITFDDGLREHYEVAWQILRSLRVPAILFVNTRPIHEQTVCTVHKIHLLRSAMPSPALWELLEEAADELGIPLDLSLDEINMRAQYPFDDEGGARLKYLLNFGLDMSDRDRLTAVCFRRNFGDAEPAISRELYLTHEHIRELGCQQAIGTHGHDHLPLALLEAKQRDRMVGRSVQLLAEWCGEAPVAISYPYGTLEATSLAVATCASRHGLEFGFTVEMAGNDETRIAASPFFLGRYDCNHMPGGKSSLFSLADLFARAPVGSWFGCRNVMEQETSVCTAHNGK